MNPKEIDRFFKGVAKDFGEEVDIILTGAAAGSLMGNLRPSMDIDFAVKIKKKRRESWKDFSRAVEKNKNLTGVSADYSEDIDRWGSITLLDYPKHARPYKKMGSLTLRVLEPAYWSIGKMTRYIEPDIEDMKAVFKKQGVKAPALARLWGKALRASPLSETLSLFRKQVEHFLEKVGPKIWSKGFDASKAIREFHKSAGIREGD